MKTTRVFRWAALALTLATAAPAEAQAPWLVAEARGATDNQPRLWLRSDLQYGRYFTPAVTGGVTLAVHHLNSDEVAGSTGFEPGLHASVGLAALRTGVRAGVRALLGVTEPAALGFADVSVNLGQDVVVRGRYQRERYVATVAAIDTTVLEQRLELSLDRAAAPGWAGALLARRDAYGDDNPVTTMYGWALAPVVRAADFGLRVGYSLAWQDSPESRWAVDPLAENEGGPRGPNAPPGRGFVPGRYDPYYTPHDALTHSLLGEIAVLVGATWLKADGSYGIAASDLAPSLYDVPGPPELSFAERSYTPYRFGLTAYAPLDAMSSLTASVQHEKTVYYRASSITLTLARTLGAR